MSFFADFKELTPEEEEKILDKMARNIVSMHLETPTIILLETFKVAIPFTTQTAGAVAVPMLDFFGVNGYDYYQLFSKQENTEKLISKIEQLVEEEKQEKKKNKKK